jgi:hypothetical protein
LYCRLEQYKWKAVVTEIKRIHKEGRPVLVGTTSVEKSEQLSEMLAQEGIKHQVSVPCVCGGGNGVCGGVGALGGGDEGCRGAVVLWYTPHCWCHGYCLNV